MTTSAWAQELDPNDLFPDLDPAPVTLDIATAETPTQNTDFDDVFGALDVQSAPVAQVTTARPASQDTASRLQVSGALTTSAGGSEIGGGLGSVYGRLAAKFKATDSIWVTGETRMFAQGTSDGHQRVVMDLSTLAVQYRTPTLQVDLGVVEEPAAWGFGYAQNLTDIINTRVPGYFLDDGDLVLGQPMLRANVNLGQHSLTAYAMAPARTPDLPQPGQRFASSLPIDETEWNRTDLGNHRWTPSFAARYRLNASAFELEASAFHGLSRESSFTVKVDSTTGSASLEPSLPEITQVGLSGLADLQPFFVYADAIYRWGQPDRLGQDTDYWAATVGVERQFATLLNDTDRLSLFAEYHHDSRGRNSTQLLNRDAVVGAVYSTSDDSQIRAEIGLAIDTTTFDTSAKISFERAITETLSVKAFGQLWLGDFDDVAVPNLDKHSYFGIAATVRF